MAFAFLTPPVMTTCRREQLRCKDDASVTTSAVSTPKHEATNWTDDWNEIVQDFVCMFAAPTVPKRQKKKPRNVQIQTRRYVEERETGSVVPEHEEVEVEAMDDSVATVISAPADKGFQLDQVVQETLYDVSNFINLYSHAQVEAEARDAPISYAGRESWIDDFSVYNENTVSEAADRERLNEVTLCDLEIVGESLGELGKAFSASDNDRATVEKGVHTLNSSSTPSTSPKPSWKAPSVAWATPVVGCGAVESIVCPRGQVQAFDAVKNTLASLGGLERLLNRAMDAAFFPERQPHMTSKMGKIKSIGADPSQKVEGDLLDDIFEHAQSHLCMAPVPRLLDDVGDSSHDVIISNSSPRKIIKDNKEDGLEDQKGDLAVDSSAAPPLCTASQRVLTQKKVSFADLAQPVDECEVSSVDNHVENEIVTSNVTPEPSIILVAPWRKETTSESDRKKREKKGMMGRLLVARKAKAW